MFSTLQTGGDDRQAIIGLLKLMLERCVVDTLLVPERAPAGDIVVQALVRDPARLEQADPFAPVIPVSAARLLSNLTMTGVKERIGAVMRNCELRAVIELAKLQQVRLDTVVLIGIDCLGTYEVKDYAALTRGGARLADELRASGAAGRPEPHPGAQFRNACRMCEKFVPRLADLSIGVYGARPATLLIEAKEELASALSLRADVPPSERQAVVSRLVAERSEERDRVFADFRAQVRDMDGLLSQFSTCIRCHNCMVNCPICYCKECIFRTPIFDHDSEQYQAWARHKGAVHLPTDTLLFHITRLNHMVTSCVGCGMCESGCPVDLPVATVFRAIGEKVQAIFDYEPGRSLDEPLPIATFREKELEDV